MNILILNQSVLMIKSVDFNKFPSRKGQFAILIEVLEHGCSHIMLWVQV